MTIALQSTLAASLGVQQLANAFSPAFDHLRILRNLIIPMPEGCAVRTARIDAVVVCETGIYLFEIKAWRNAFVYRKKSEQAPPRWFLRLQASPLFLWGCASAAHPGAARHAGARRRQNAWRMPKS